MTCITLPERVIFLGSSLVRHIMPLVHVQRISLLWAQNDLREQAFFRENWNRAYDFPAYGAFRIDFGRRILRGELSFEEAAAYLERHADTWPTYDFTAEVRYWRAKARGERFCDACGEILPPAPPCGCGCQAPPKRATGFSLALEAAGFADQDASGGAQ